MGSPQTAVDLGNADVAVAHWNVRSWGGAEYLVTKLASALNLETVFTIGGVKPDIQNPFGNVKFKNVIDNLSFPRMRKIQQKFGRAFEYSLWEDIDWRELNNPDIIISSGATTRSIITPDDTLHVNYCHSPPRWLYDLYHERKQSLPGLVFRPIIRYYRMRDQTVDPRVDHYFVNSPVIRRRLWKYAKRDSTVLYPPIALEQYSNKDETGYYLHLGRLDKEKGIPAIVNAFLQTDYKLVLAGSKGDITRSIMQQIENSDNIDWYGFVDSETKYSLLAECRAVIYNGLNEDFGIAPIEANASGKAVIAPDTGFPRIFIEHGKNGLLHDGTASDIREKVNSFETNPFEVNPGDWVRMFGEDVFENQLFHNIRNMYQDFIEVPNLHQGKTESNSINKYPPFGL